MKVKRKPDVFEAEQYFPDKKPWPKGCEDKPLRKEYTGLGCCYIAATQGLCEVFPGYWIIRSAEGALFWCTPEEYEALYESV